MRLLMPVVVACLRGTWAIEAGGEAAEAGSRGARAGVPTAVTLIGGVAAMALAWVGLLGFLAQSVQALPPDRVYEMVSPPEKGAANVKVHAASSPSGDAILYFADGSFAGNPSNALSNPYIASRTPPSWVSAGISAPLASDVLITRAPVLGVSHDHGKSVVQSNAQLTPDAWPTFVTDRYGAPLYLHDHASDTYMLLTPVPLGGWTWEHPDFGTVQSTPYGSVFSAGDADFSHVLFETAAELTDDAISLDDQAVKLYQYANGALSLASILPNGDPVSGSAGTAGSPNLEQFILAEMSDSGMISRDGSRIFFTSPASGPGGEAGALHVREQGASTLIDPNAVFRGATPDGDSVFFTSGGELKRYDVATGATTVLSVDSEPADGASSAAGVLGFSDDGRRVYFVAHGQLVEGGLTDAGDYLYLWDDGALKFIASASGFGSAGSAWSTDFFARRHRYASTSGEALLFRTSAQLTADDNAGTQQIYLYDAGDSTPLLPDIVCVSCNPGGTPPLSDASEFNTTEGAPVRRHLSDAGDRAFFDTPEALVPRDTNQRRDAYMWENGQRHLISTGRSPWISAFVDASASGDDVFFITFERLVGWDQDDLADLYDARVGGGLPEPPSLVGCEADECQGAPSSPPPLPDPGSVHFNGEVNVVPMSDDPFGVRRLNRKQRARLARGRRVALRIRVEQAGRVSVAARAKLGKRRRIVARGSARTLRAGVARVLLRLSNPARRRLAAARKMRLFVAIRFAGERQRMTFNLRRPRAHRSAGRAGFATKRDAG